MNATPVPGPVTSEAIAPMKRERDLASIGQVVRAANIVARDVTERQRLEREAAERTLRDDIAQMRAEISEELARSLAETQQILRAEIEDRTLRARIQRAIARVRRR